MPAGFRQPETGVAGDSKPGGGAPSRPAQVDGPVHGLCAGGLQGASCQKPRAGEGVLCAHLPLVRLVNFSAK